MAPPYEQGQKEIVETLEWWQEYGRTLEDACRVLGADRLQEFAHAQDMAQTSDKPEFWNMQIEYFKGMLSRLD